MAKKETDAGYTHTRTALGNGNEKSLKRWGGETSSHLGD